MAPLKALRHLSLAALWMLAATPAHAQQSVRLVEQDIKAALLYNFLLYTEWPAPQQNNVVVCVYGRDPFSGRLASMVGRTVNQRPIEVRSVAEIADTDTCALLFVNAEERPHWPQLHAHLEHASVLTVSDYDGFAAAGGMIEFTRANSRIAMRINRRAVTAGNLVVEDRLLRLAERD